MAIPQIALEMVKQVSMEVVKERIKETGKQVGSEIGKALKETVGEEMTKELLNEAIKGFVNDISGEVLGDLDPEMQVMAAAIMKSYAQEGVSSWTGIELKENGNMALKGEGENGETFDIEYVKDTSEFSANPSEVFSDLSQGDADNKIVLLSEDFYDLPKDVMEAVKMGGLSADIGLVMIESEITSGS